MNRTVVRHVNRVLILVRRQRDPKSGRVNGPLPNGNGARGDQASHVQRGLYRRCPASQPPQRHRADHMRRRAGWQASASEVHVRDHPRSRRQSNRSRYSSGRRQATARPVSHGSDRRNGERIRNSCRSLLWRNNVDNNPRYLGSLQHVVRRSISPSGLLRAKRGSASGCSRRTR